MHCLVGKAIISPVPLPCHSPLRADKLSTMSNSEALKCLDFKVRICRIIGFGDSIGISSSSRFRHGAQSVLDKEGTSAFDGFQKFCRQSKIFWRLLFFRTFTMRSVSFCSFTMQSHLFLMLFLLIFQNYRAPQLSCILPMELPSRATRSEPRRPYQVKSSSTLVWLAILKL